MATATELMLTQQARETNFSRLLRDCADQWRARGWIEHLETRMVPRGSHYDDRMELRIFLRPPPTEGVAPPLVYEISRSEIEMGGPDEFEAWLRYVSDGIRHEVERRRWPDPVAHSPDRRQHWEALRQLIDNVHLTANPILNHEAVFREFYEQYQQWVGIDLAEDAESAKERAAADAKARDLFRSVAGEEAYRTLEAGKPLPIRGSQGTPYLLHKQASYCIERPSDGARLCAVVPGVPLWDHLLGVKLMVEHDEPTFLATANVASGRRFSATGFIGARLWMGDCL